jgi:hypothetical protein
MTSNNCSLYIHLFPRDVGFQKWSLTLSLSLSSYIVSLYIDTRGFRMASVNPTREASCAPATDRRITPQQNVRRFKYHEYHHQVRERFVSSVGSFQKLFITGKTKSQEYELRATKGKLRASATPGQPSRRAEEPSGSQSAAHGEIPLQEFPQNGEDHAAEYILPSAATPVPCSISSESQLRPETLVPPFSANISSIHSTDINLPSPKVRLVDKKRHLYVGTLREVPLHPTIEKAWTDDIIPRLITDLQPISLNEGCSIEAELCMAGFAADDTDADADTDHVTLTPCIWISCGNKRCKEKVARVVKSLSWLKGLGKGAVEVHSRPLNVAISESTEVYRTSNLASSGQIKPLSTIFMWDVSFRALRST